MIVNFFGRQVRAAENFGEPVHQKQLCLWLRASKIANARRRQPPAGARQDTEMPKRLVAKRGDSEQLLPERRNRGKHCCLFAPERRNDILRERGSVNYQGCTDEEGSGELTESVDRAEWQESGYTVVLAQPEIPCYHSHTSP
jgi:hypothetical protein